MEAAFEPFYYHGALAQMQELTGMEMAIASRVFQAYKGSLEVKLLHGNTLAFIGDAHFPEKRILPGRSGNRKRKDGGSFP